MSNRKYSGKDIKNNRTAGSRPNGGRTTGNRASGSKTPDSRPNGNSAPGNKMSGNKTNANRTSVNKVNSKRPNGNRTTSNNLNSNRLVNNRADSGRPNNNRPNGSRPRGRRTNRSGLVIGVIIAAFVIFNIVIIVLNLKGNDKKDKSEASPDKTEAAISETTELTEASTDTTAETGSTTEMTTEEPSTEKPRDMLVNIRKEFSEYSEEDQKKVLYIHQNMYLYTTDLILMLHKNHEALQFIYEYPDARLRPINNDISKELKDVKNGKIPLFLQWDQRWGYMEYGDGLMAYNGCGPTCLSMVVTYLTGSGAYSPAVIGKYALENDYYFDGQGTAWSLIHTACEKFGIRSYEVGLSESSMAEAVESGNPIIACVDKGDFTDGGHFIVLTGYKDGKFSVNDPNSVKNSEKMWDYDRLEGQIAGLWAFYRDETLTTEDMAEESSTEFLTTEEDDGEEE